MTSGDRPTGTARGSRTVPTGGSRRALRPDHDGATDATITDATIIIAALP